MADIWILCKKENNVLTAIGVNDTEAETKNMARDGDYVGIPVTFGKIYDNLINENMVGAVTFSNISLYTLIQQAKNQLEIIDGRLDSLETAINNGNARLDTLEGQMQTVITQGQAMNQAIQNLDARVTALEGA